ncbi:hypothetical protein MS3_00003989 [Schistosoma haematobium]|uniref:Uncharacterized protein n=1 Tax=Schistosoma haematobium TaxID=6185 RepID=A0A6A5DNA3_SCHHA|nr:hypothetical protein MS3_00003989 [Schistosoma haematobium]KAH9594116.1 hypothetical protein MS3_00003989 [Schistosoma haematobium]CAH8438055.1 unnamed protein product [Schistosoma haematobium]CAH8438635.1 unnamed protein product [Schistosoma haematobium]
MKLAILLIWVYCIFISAANINDTAVPHEEKVNEYELERGMKPVLCTLRQAMMNGMGKILKTYDTYSRKDDLDKKLLEVAKIIGRRMEKRFDYLAMKLEYLLMYSTC